MDLARQYFQMRCTTTTHSRGLMLHVQVEDLSLIVPASSVTDVVPFIGTSLSPLG
jgi:hypothetical protein